MLDRNGARIFTAAACTVSGSIGDGLFVDIAGSKQRTLPWIEASSRSRSAPLDYPELLSRIMSAMVEGSV